MTRRDQRFIIGKTVVSVLLILLVFKLFSHTPDDTPPPPGVAAAVVSQAGEVVPGIRGAALADPDDQLLRVKFDTTKGPFHVTFHRAWAPLGFDRVKELVEQGYFNDGIAFFRTIPNFVLQYGIHGDPLVSREWRPRTIADDPTLPSISNAKYTVTFAHAGKNTRTTQFFVNIHNNKALDSMGFPPLGVVDDEAGKKVIDSIHLTGEGAPQGNGPDQGAIQSGGNEYLKKGFPGLDYITHASIVSGPDM